MATLRFAARRLGHRALDRLEAIYTVPASTAAGEGLKRNLIRAVGPASSTSTKPLDERRKEYIVRTHLAQIQKKKEELFSLIGELDSCLPSRCTRDNKQLAIELSAQVEPKPSDPQWRWYRGAKRLNNSILYGGCLILGLAVSKDFQKTYVQKYQS